MKEGQLVYVKSLTFTKDGDYAPVKKYAVVMNDFSCDWEHISSGPPVIRLAVEGGIQTTVKPIKIEFVKNLSEKKARQIAMEIVLSL